VNQLLNVHVQLHGVAVRKPRHGGARRGAGRPRQVQDPVRLAIDHEREDAEALRELAEERGTSVAELVRAAVRVYVKRYRGR
jgi:hypothetical protein